MALAAPSSATIGRNEREGTSAYDAGHVAGRALATTHHTAAPPKNAGDDFTSQLLALLGHNTGPSPAQLAAQAKSLAASDVAAQVAAYRQQQTDLTNQAAARAAQINAATLAASKYLYGPTGGNTVADATSASFNNAAKTEAAIAGGYSGQLRQTATDAAAKVQAGLDAIGAPAGQAPSSTQGQDLGNVLYGLGGQIPANVLVTAGQGAADAARFLPGATLGYGAGEASLARSAGASAAAGLLPDIRNAVSQQPKLAQQYLSSLGTQADNAQSRQQSALALASLIQNRGAAQGIATAKANAPKAPKTFGGAKTGYYTIDPTGKVTQVTSPVVTPAKGAGGGSGLTANKQADLITSGSKLARTLKKGAQPQFFHGKPVADSGTKGALYADVLAQEQAHFGPSAWGQAQAKRITNLEFKPGEGGRPYAPAQARQVANTNAKTAFKKGVPYATAIAQAIAKSGGTVPAETIQQEFTRVYYAGPYSPVKGSPHFGTG